MAEAAVLTTARTLQRGEGQRGTKGAYHRLVYGPGELHIRRAELAPEDAPRRHRRSLLHFAHLTDLHIIDAESPGRFEFMERLFGGPEILHYVLPAHRPQEALNLHAAEAMIRTINAIPGSPETGAPLQLLLCSGDNTDNQQLNELRRFVGLMEGRVVTPGSGGPAYEGVQALDWADPEYWHPDPFPDRYKRGWGFPEYPGLLEEALRPFQAEGARLPWLSCYGNHDALILGTSITNPAYERIVTGGRKAVEAPVGFDPLEHLSTFVSHPDWFLRGPARAVTPDPDRRTYDKREFIEAHLAAAGEPGGHGFTPDNLPGSVARYVYDAHPQVRLLALDTTNPAGHFQGSIGAQQLRWLEQRLIEVHSRYQDASGARVETGNPDRLVVICSHHGLGSLVNPILDDPGPNSEEADLPRVLGTEVESLLHRFPNVILWLSGHVHRNRVRPRCDPTGRSAGFWEVTTSSLVDWPTQGRLVEIISHGNGTLSILCTMVDRQAPPDPRSAQGPDRLASIHRELAANDPHAGLDVRKGGREDRNVELLIAAPFPID